MSIIERLNEFAVKWLTSVEPAQREVIIAAFFLLSLLVTGTAGYTLIEGWNPMDSLYMTFITLTTIGFSEVHPLSSGARVFTIFVIDRDDDEIEELRDRNLLFVHGDAEDEETLLAASLDKARGLILALPEDSANVFVTLMARELTPDIFILARTNYHKNRQKLLHAGANKVVSPDEIWADRMAQVILRPNVDRFMEQVLRAGALGLLMDEVEGRPGAPLAGKSLAESNFRQQFDAIVIAVIEGGSGEMQFNPSGT